jgi:glyceraldehyde-3-phosphate dehydrogenase/erythrose-4-phosphate dehydrogenase
MVVWTAAYYHTPHTTNIIFDVGSFLTILALNDSFGVEEALIATIHSTM